MVKYHPADVSVLMTVNEPATLRRDVNEDGFVNVTDVTALVSIILGYNNEHDISTETTFLRGDINEDGFVNVTDVTALVNIILGNKE
ncbi:MAG: dockerin type I repeat-containing protein [Bacteroidaceae bacterium]|nr:dockerin type I repeat-containing protein [Bacteroidaceae bacterium]